VTVETIIGQKMIDIENLPTSQPPVKFAPGKDAP
jgi:hypothetical protein